MVFAQLGNLTFQVVGPLIGLSGRRRYGYAQHPRAAEKATLQHTADELEQLELKLLFHRSFGNPGEQLAALYALADRHEAVPLVFASGEVVGRYVVEEIEAARETTDPNGVLIQATVGLKLLEWVGEVEDLSILTRRQDPPIGLRTNMAGEAKNLVEAYVPPDAAPSTVAPSAITRWGI